MKRRNVFAVIILLAILVGGVSIYRYMYAEHRDIAAAEIDYEFQATQLVNVMANAESAKEYVDKVIQVSGTITGVENQSIILNEVIQVDLTAMDPSNIVIEKKVVIKGRCLGYDDLLELVKIDQATLLNN